MINKTDLSVRDQCLEDAKKTFPDPKYEIFWDNIKARVVVRFWGQCMGWYDVEHKSPTIGAWTDAR